MGVGRTTHHGSVTVLQGFKALFRRVEASVQFDRELRSARFQGDHPVVLQGGNRAVLFGVETLQPRFARMHAESGGSGIGHPVHEGCEQVVAVEIIDAHAVLHRDGPIAGRHHRLHALRHPLGFRHQTGTEIAGLHPRAGAAHIQIDFVVAPVRGHAGGFCQQLGVIASHLENDRMFFWIETEQSFPAVAVVQRLGHHHFAVEQ